MSAVALFRLTRAPHAQERPFLEATLRRILREIRLWQARRAMGALDEAALHDIGVARGAIDRAVRYGRPARPR